MASFRDPHPGAPEGDHAVVSVWPGFAASTVAAATGQLNSSTRPLRCTTRTTSRAPQGTMQARQHRKLLPMTVSSSSSVVDVGAP
ncbi:hypothetical protein Zm00014a_020867 [Zea mays]|uniref:Uncharacterized protein n=1 Tax=Zea mays TaxID=4577 RepID=A0A3L6DTP4_MAIZE|nr:hypothetical protein Zm00014a_020867 [Zea mays]